MSGCETCLSEELRLIAFILIFKCYFSVRKGIKIFIFKKVKNRKPLQFLEYLGVCHINEESILNNIYNNCIFRVFEKRK